MRIVVAPDSFKGTLSAKEVANGVADRLRRRFATAEVATLPLSDGGDGLTECLQEALRMQPVACTVTGPDGQKRKAIYLLGDGVALVEMAQAAGLTLLPTPDVWHATTYGVGEMIAHAEANGAGRILLGLGGSATNDLGCGMAAALGCRFWDGKAYFVPVAETLQSIQRIEYAAPHDVVALCDVKNPLYGPNGAAYVYGPQKGADTADLPRLDAGLQHVANILATDGKTGIDAEGSGAAGGLGAGVVAFLGGTLRRGIDAVLDLLGYDQLVADADLVVTGEGRLDGQSFDGKVIDGVLARTPCPVVALVGQIAPQLDYIGKGLAAAFATADSGIADYRQALDATADKVAEWVAKFMISR